MLLLALRSAAIKGYKYGITRNRLPSYYWYIVD